MLDPPIADAKIGPIGPTSAAHAQEDPTVPGTRFAEPSEPEGGKSGRTGLLGRALRLRPEPGRPDVIVKKALTIEDIRVGGYDARGNEISAIYAVQPSEYAIYQAGEVMIQFADDAAKAQAQRKAILPVSALRAEVSALANGLTGRNVCDRQLAYGLQLALDGALDAAKATIAAAKTAALAQRAANGRFQYLKYSFATAAIFLALLFGASRLYPFHIAADNLWLAAKAGLVGAVFSIALAIRGRTVALDTEPLDNITDGALRLLIGTISAGVLLLLFSSGIAPSLKIGEAEFQPASLTWQPVLIIGFVAGFLERLVPDLLDKRNSQGHGATASA